MTDTTPTTAPPKKMWTRCTGCKQRIYNDPLDIKIHAPICPQDMLLTLQKLTIALFGDPSIRKDPNALLARVGLLEQTVGDLDEHITAEPTLDPDGIDSDAYTDVVGDPEALEEDASVPTDPTPAPVEPYLGFQSPIQTDPGDLYSPHSTFGLNP